MTLGFPHIDHVELVLTRVSEDAVLEEAVICGAELGDERVNLDLTLTYE